MKLLQITDENFDAEVRDSAIPVLIDFWGPRCAPCIALDPFMEDLSDEYRDRVKIVKVVAPESRKLCASLRVMGLPTMMALSDGEETARIGGDDISGDDIRNLLESVID